MKPRFLNIKQDTISSKYSKRLLASPSRRILAFIIDIIILFIPSTLAAAAIALFSLYITDNVGFNAVKNLYVDYPREESKRIELYSDLAPLLHRIASPGFPCEASEAVISGDLTKAGELLLNHSFNINVSYSGNSQPPPGTILIELKNFIPTPIRAFAFFGIAALYFTFFTSKNRNKTIGKRMTGIYVAVLNGETLSYWDSFKRYGGYMASLGTFGFGILDLFKEPNRQLVHDKIVNTAVLRKSKLVN